jgi:hypothetical protein
MEADSIKTMKAYGLVEIALSPAEEGTWKSEMQTGMGSLFGKSFNKDLFGQIDALLKEFRKK